MVSAETLSRYSQVAREIGERQKEAQRQFINDWERRFHIAKGTLQREN